MISSFKQFWKDLFGLIWFALKVSLGLLVAVGLLRFLESPSWDLMLQKGVAEWEIVGKLETAVRIVSSLFVGTWGIHFLNKTIFRNRLIQTLAFTKGKANKPLNFLSYAFVHLDDAHLQSNTPLLLLFGGITFLMLPTLQLFIITTIIILVANSVGVLMFGPKAPYIGASGLLLGYFSFLETFGFVTAQGWQAVVAGIILLIFGVRIFRVMANRSNQGTFIIHLWGFIAGLLASRAIFMMLLGQ